MVNFGTIHDWRPEPGSVVSWSASAETLRRVADATLSPVSPSYQQAQHVRSYRDHEQRGREFARLGIGAWDVDGVCNIGVMTDAINSHFRRHDTYHSRFAFGADDVVRRYVIDEPAAIDFVPVEHGTLETDAIRAHLLESSGTPMQWDCFTIGIIQRADHYTVYVSIDHLHTDGMSTGILYVELALVYAGLLQGAALPLPEPASYVEFSRREQQYIAELTADSEPVVSWREFAEAGGGTLPDFPLPLGDRTVPTVGSIITATLMDAEQTSLFDNVCRDAGVRFSGGVFACAGLIDRALTGDETYRGITPYDRRSTPEEQLAVGWYASFIPFTVDMRDDAFVAVARGAQESFDKCQSLARVPFERVTELVPGLHTPEFDVPMLSFIDARKIPVSAEWDRVNGGIYGDSRSSDQVCIWVNRFEDETKLTISFPDNAVARDSVARYIEEAQLVYQHVASSQFVS